MTDIKTVLTDEKIAEIAEPFDIVTIPGMLNHAFARAIEAAVLAASAQAQTGGVVAWITDDYLFDPSATTYDSTVAQRWRDKGWRVGELRDTAAPVDAQDADTKLRKYGRHLPDCLGGLSGSKRACTCGFDAALQASQSPQDQVKEK